jgi:hypothetical protein
MMRDALFLVVFTISALVIGVGVLADVWTTEPATCPESSVCRPFQW